MTSYSPLRFSGSLTHFYRFLNPTQRSFIFDLLDCYSDQRGDFSAYPRQNTEGRITYLQVGGNFDAPNPHFEALLVEIPAHFSLLETLDITYNFSFTPPLHLAPLPHLTQLSLTGHGFSHFSPDFFTSLPQLHELTFKRTQFLHETDLGTSFYELPALTYLYFHNTPLRPWLMRPFLEKCRSRFRLTGPRPFLKYLPHGKFTPK